MRLCTIAILTNEHIFGIITAGGGPMTLQEVLIGLNDLTEEENRW